MSLFFIFYFAQTIITFTNFWSVKKKEGKTKSEDINRDDGSPFSFVSTLLISVAQKLFSFGCCQTSPVGHWIIVPAIKYHVICVSCFRLFFFYFFCLSVLLREQKFRSKSTRHFWLFWRGLLIFGSFV